MTNSSQDTPHQGNVLAARSVRADRAYAAFLPAAVEVAVRPAPRVVPIMIIIIVAFVAAAIGWSFFSHLDVFTNAAGRVRAATPPAVVQPMEAGRIREIAVRNGSSVRKGDLVIGLDDIEVMATLNAATAARYSWLAEVERRRAALENARTGIWTAPAAVFDPHIPEAVVARETSALAADFATVAANLASLTAQIEEAEARRERFRGMKTVQEELVAILSEKTKMAETLLASGTGARKDLLSNREVEARAAAEHAESAAQYTEAEASIRNLREQSERTAAAFVAEQSQGIQAAERQIEQLDQEIVKQRARLGNLALRAPLDGTVQQLAATGIGQVVTAGQTLMLVVPNGAELFVDALVPSSEIGFVRVGDEVVIKADAFPFTRYGSFSGKVETLSREAVTIRDATALQDASTMAAGAANTAASGVPDVSGLFFIARVALDAAEIEVNGGTLRLEPGMTVRAEIRTETRRVIDYVLSPVVQVLREAGHER